MKRDEFIEALDRLGIWRSHGQRASHKSLLLLLALGRVAQDRDRLARYQDIQEAALHAARWRIG